MPIYDFRCTKCGFIFEDIFCEIWSKSSKCPHCKSFARKIFSPTRFIPFKPYVETNLGDEPVFIDNPKRLRQECNKVGADYQ